MKSRLRKLLALTPEERRALALAWAYLLVSDLALRILPLPGSSASCRGSPPAAGSRGSPPGASRSSPASPPAITSARWSACRSPWRSRRCCAGRG